jgi:transforming growth factor-beta-induced protein
MKRLSRIGAVVTAGLVTLAGLSIVAPADAKTAKPTKDIVDTAVGAGSFKTLAAALGAAGLVDTLKGPGPFTVFAPTDAAFAKLPAGTVDTLLKPENKDALTRVLTYHVVAGKVLAKSVVKLNGKSVPTISGDEVKITVAGKSVKVNDSNVTAVDVLATNGVIHVIDAVLLPPNLKLAEAPKPTTTTPPAATKDIVDTAVAAGSFKTLAAALGAAGLVDTLKGAGPFTVFAPTDAAFAKLPAGTVETLLKPENKAALAGILTYHVVAGKVPASEVVKLDGKTVKTVNGAEIKIKLSGGKVFLNDSMVVTTDIVASNGIIHVIDAVLLPPTAAAATPAAAPVAGNIVDVAVNNNLNTLVAAIKAAGLVETLQGPGPFTVFAPTELAFKVLPSETLATLLKPENKSTLASILTYHVVAGKAYTAKELASGTIHDLKTVNGKKVNIRLDAQGKVRINDSVVLVADVKASNGIVHVIDTVLIP